MAQNNEILSGYNTTVQPGENGETKVLFYETAVVTFDGAQILLHTGGWWTKSTKVRMNQASRQYDLAYRVFQKEDGWYVEYDGTVHPFGAEQIRLDRKTGEVTPVV